MPNEFKPTIGGKIRKREAEAWIKRYDDEDRLDKEKDTRSVFFGIEFLHEVLKNAPEAAGISFFFAKKHSEFANKNVVSLVLVPRKEDGTLIWPDFIEGKDGESKENGAYDKGANCPPACG